MDSFLVCFQELSEMIDCTKEAFLECTHVKANIDNTALLVYILWFRAFHKMLEAFHEHTHKTISEIEQSIENKESDFLFIGAVMHLLREADFINEWNKLNNNERAEIVYEQWLGHNDFPPLIDDITPKKIAQGRFDEIVGLVIETRGMMENNLLHSYILTLDNSSRSETALWHTQLVDQLLNFSKYRAVLAASAPLVTNTNPVAGAFPLMVNGIPIPKNDKTQKLHDTFGIGSASRNVIKTGTDINQDEKRSIVRKTIQNIKNVSNVANKLYKGKLLQRIKAHSLKGHEFEDFLLDIQTTVKGLGADSEVVKLIFRKVLQRSDKQKRSGKGKWKDWITEDMIKDFADMTPDNVTKIGTAAAGFIQQDKLEGLKALASFSIGNIYSKCTSSSTTDEAALRAIFSAVHS